MKTYVSYQYKLTRPRLGVKIKNCNKKQLSYSAYKIKISEGRQRLELPLIHKNTVQSVVWIILFIASSQ